MPVYIYKFDDGTTVEVQQAITEDAFTDLDHPETHLPQAVKRVPMIAGVAFKGSGFYKTDKGK